jgi:hypothetical protein
LRHPEVVSLQRLGCVKVIVPERFWTLEAVGGDDMQVRQPVSDNEVLRRRVAIVGLEPSRCPGDPTR